MWAVFVKLTKKINIFSILWHVQFLVEMFFFKFILDWVFGDQKICIYGKPARIPGFPNADAFFIVF